MKVRMKGIQRISVCRPPAATTTIAAANNTVLFM